MGTVFATMAQQKEQITHTQEQLALILLILQVTLPLIVVGLIQEVLPLDFTNENFLLRMHHINDCSFPTCTTIRAEIDCDTSVTIHQ